uniref:Uncharacterized protein n=1 Tax=Rhizophora mucronata TaxID=61149 RepID=A0A2P2Q6Z8_RHIMU
MILCFLSKQWSSLDQGDTMMILKIEENFRELHTRRESNPCEKQPCCTLAT